MTRPLARLYRRTLGFDEFSPVGCRVRRFLAHKLNHPNMETR